MKKKEIIVLLLMGILLSGCATSNSTIRMPLVPTDANEPQAAIEFTGKAADIVAEKISTILATNIQTKEGRLNELVGSLKEHFGWLFITLIGGLIFWGYTRSKLGWVIPAASLAGMAVIVTFSSLADWVPYGVVAVALALLVWKAVEYQKERNAETLKQKEKSK